MSMDSSEKRETVKFSPINDENIDTTLTSLVFSSTLRMLSFVTPKSRGTSLFFPFIFSYKIRFYLVKHSIRNSLQRTNLQLNLNPTSDKHLISPNNFTP